MKSKLVLSAAAAAVLAGCASMMYTPPTQQETMAVIKSSFHDRGIAKVDRLSQSELQRVCTETKNDPPKDLRARLEKAALSSVRYPADGKWMDNWKEGEKVAQTGRGLEWSDKEGAEAGGNCYACHQLSKEEISLGSIGQSLYNYGKLRGVADPASPAYKAVVEYTWGKLWNSKAYAACSNMPRFGHMKILDENQIRDLMALLLDPKSPVNQ